MKVLISLADRSAALYIRHIIKGLEGIEFYGVTDSSLEELGVKRLASVDDLSVVGFWEALPRIPKAIGLLRKIEEMAEKMDVLVLCDAPAFHLPLLKRVRKKAKKIIYFIPPQAWAWKEERARVVTQYADEIVVILPFEVDFYRKWGKEVHYVGHPLVDLAKPTLTQQQVVEKVGTEKYVAVLPGSRWSEIKRHAPYLRPVLDMLYKETGLYLVVPTFEAFLPYLQKEWKDLPVKFFTPSSLPEPSRNIMSYAKAGIIASGTADLEASLLSCPHVTFYRTHLITYLIGKRLARVSYIALTNLVAGRQVVPELVQKSPSELYNTFRQLINSPELLSQQKEYFGEMRNILGPEGVLDRLRSLFLQLFYER
ncbi:lipid-A-disaccharide synthase [Thermocrinis albus DSM 14484]|uniref:Lipid-A-disaccharide synthase n=1 Tax=Thermocrinis albus (strain DSM 14484 / JCM 11386 / HI 11/12) TaxID=638303 RepID=D3SNM7_THEAH|nr:lipid-A-disaccharide synthase [Thermocrinis albus]ADC88764.1 lipid-A-disaccharide synthase [Thermocrinis albus DSM 14484]